MPGPPLRRRPHASLTIGLCSFSSAGPDVNPDLVLEEKLATEAATAPEPSSPKYPIPDIDYVNHGFEDSTPGASAAGSSLPKSGQKF